ncbi:MAG: exopolysaccharide biosynthesis polyprenyl glycosylphosphotransferase [Clostridiales bacterium]|nr:exopolysaccharide biosynthesis polyprenyl glycosylphosphotransferase [Clostridiales bacterium]
MQRKRFYATQLMKLCFQVLLYIFLFVSFFGMLSITNEAILNLSRTAGTTIATFICVMLLLTVVYGGYDIGVKKMRSVFASISLTTFFTDLITYLILQIMNTNPKNPDANAQFVFWGEDLALLFGAFILQLCFIYFFVSIGYRYYFRINPPQNSCIVTSSQELANHVASKMETFRQKYKLTDVVHYECPDVKQTILKHDVIFLAGIPDTEEAQLEAYCYKHNKTIYLLAELEDVIISTAQQSILDDAPFLYIHRTEPTLMQLFLKRACDILISLLGLVILSPVMLVTAIVLRASGNGSVLFRQKRATINGNIFEIVKFRTMYAGSREEENTCSTQKDDCRVTPVGSFLRKYRIDELPQLWNVLCGDMSIVGPRPEMLENVDRYTREVPEFAYRQQMKAGLTGLAQIEGKYNTSPKDKAILDLLYIENFSLSYDFKLILRTLTIFFRRDSTEGFGEKAVNCPKMRVDSLSPSKPSRHVAKTARKGKNDQTPLRAAL